MREKDFMDTENILENLRLNDAYTIKDWYEEYVCAGAEFERMADALYDIDEKEFLWQVADFISEEFDEDELLETIKEQEWEWELTPLEKFKTDVADEDADFINCTIKYKDSGDTEDVMISLVSKDDLEDEENGYDYTDEDIFFYAEDVSDVERLFDEKNGEDFVIVDYDSIEY